MNNMDKIIASASEKLGIPSEKLKKTLESGNVNDILANLSKADSEKIKSLMGNKTMLDKLMKSPKAMEFMKQFNNK